MKHWLFTAISFAAVLGVSVYAVRSGAPHGVDLAIPLTAHLRDFLGVPVIMDNDANAGAVGEAVYGAGKSFDPLFYMTLWSPRRRERVIERDPYEEPPPRAY